ncbi:MAG: B12-binding domain-containing radical SAM protein [Deltaproteobacteria bacterium]|nr:B12-binding domain-containing radical SAM protein [Deltaproteobacteria bacterium]
MYLVAALKQAGHEVHFIDTALEDGWEEHAVKLAPDVIGYSVLTGSQGYFLGVNARLKRRMKFLSLWGGPHPTFFPEFIDEKEVDVLCIGEGDQAIVEIANAVDRGRTLDSIANLHVKGAGGVVRNDPRPLVQDIDALPHPDRSILVSYPQYRYVTSRAVIASRGCPHACTFCYNSRLRSLYKGNGRYTRLRSVDSIIEECSTHMQDQWATQIIFKDDLFAHDEGFVHDFSQSYRREIGMPFLCNVRADRMTERMADDLARAGARVVHFGVESGNDRVRREILGRPISRQSMVNTARWLRERGILVYTFNIIGIPGETPEEAMETLEFNASLHPHLAVFTLFQPYPKTPLGDRAVAMGWSDPGYEGFSPTYYKNSMKHLPHERTYRNMVHLFPVAVRSRLFRRLVPRLLRLPFTPLYSAVDFTFKATRFVFTLGIVPPRDIALYSGRWVPSRPPRRRPSPGTWRNVS